MHDLRVQIVRNLQGPDEKVPMFGRYGVSVTLLRIASRSPSPQRRVLARPRCTQANGHGSRRDTVLQSSAVALAQASAPTAVRSEIATQRASFLQTSGCRGLMMAAGNATDRAGSLWSCAASSRCLFRSGRTLGAARRVRSAGSTLARELKEHRTFDSGQLFPSDLRLGTRTDGARPQSQWTDC